MRQVKEALSRWKEQEVKPADSLTTLARKEYLEKQLERLDRLMQETSQVRREAQQTIKEAEIYE